MDGLILVDKPVGLTSHDVVARSPADPRRQKRSGHFGTLDPWPPACSSSPSAKPPSSFRYLSGEDKTLHGTDPAGLVAPTPMTPRVRPTARSRRSVPMKPPSAEAMQGLRGRNPPDPAPLLGQEIRGTAALYTLPGRNARCDLRSPGGPHLDRSPSSPARPPLASISRSPAPPGPISAPWPTTWAGLWAAAATWPSSSGPRVGRLLGSRDGLGPGGGRETCRRRGRSRDVPRFPLRSFSPSCPATSPSEEEARTRPPDGPPSRRGEETNPRPAPRRAGVGPGTRVQAFRTGTEAPGPGPVAVPEARIRPSSRS